MVATFGNERSPKGKLFNWTEPNVSDVDELCYTTAKRAQWIWASSGGFSDNSSLTARAILRHSS